MDIAKPEQTSLQCRSCAPFRANVLSMYPSGTSKYLDYLQNTILVENLIFSITQENPQHIWSWLQWTYRAANSWGTDPDGTSCIGCGEQEHFRACADIKIEGDGSPVPSTTATVPTITTTEGNNPVTEAPTTSAPCNGGGSGNGDYKRVCCKFSKP